MMASKNCRCPYVLKRDLDNLNMPSDATLPQRDCVDASPVE
jgi:hypothetical protein